MLDWTLQLLNHAWAPWAAVGFLLLWGGGHWFALQSHFFRPLHRQLVEMRRQLEETPEEPLAFAACYPEMAETMARHRLLIPAWTAFSRTLELPATRGIPVRGSRAPGHFFNAETLMGREAAHYYYNTIPNLLLGVGVLLTLIGLVAAIHFAIRGMASEDLYATQGALMGLLNAASVKFLSSIAGFAIALLFSWEEKRHRHRLERDAEQICQLWLDRVEWTGDDQVDRDQLQATRAQSRHLQEIADRLHQMITQPTFQAQTGRSTGDALLNEAVVERLATRLDTRMSQLQETVATLDQTLRTRPTADEPWVSSGTSTALLERIAAQLEEGVATLTARSALAANAQGALLERLGEQMAQGVATLTHQAMSGGGRGDLEPLPLLLEQLGIRLEEAIVGLGERLETAAGQSGAEEVLQAVRREGAQLLRASEESTRALLELVGRRFSEATATTTLAELRPAEREGLLERVAVRMEQAVASLGEVGLAPFFDSLRREMALLPGLGQQTMTETLQTSFARITQQLDSVTAALENKVWAADTLPDMTGLVKAIHGEGERLLRANEQAIGRLLAELTQQGMAPAVPGGEGEAITLLARMTEQLAAIDQTLTTRAALAEQSVAVGAPPPDWEGLFGRLRREGERLVQANETAMVGLLNEVTRRFAAVSATTALAELHPEERSELLDGVAVRMDRAVASLGELGLTPFLDGIRQEIGQLIKTNQQAVGQLLDELSRRAREQGPPLLGPGLAELTQLMTRQRGEEMRLLERVATEVNRAVAALDARIGRATPLQLRTLVDTVQEQGQEIVRALRSGGGAGRVGEQALLPAATPRPVVGAPPSSAQVTPPTAPVALPVAQGEAVGAETWHALLTPRVDQPAPAVVKTGTAETAAAAGGWIAVPAQPVAAPSEAGLVVAYQTVHEAEAGVQTAISAWVAARVAGEVVPPEQGRSTGKGTLSRMLPALAQRAWEMRQREDRRALVVMAGQGTARDLEVRANQLDDPLARPFAPALVQEFGAKKAHPWQPFTVFVARQTAEFLESQKRFSLFK
ncbi:MAG: hypothetical protein H7838_12475 [Magnetococcus sp. DMHC-8]